MSPLPGCPTSGGFQTWVLLIAIPHPGLEPRETCSSFKFQVLILFLERRCSTTNGRARKGGVRTAQDEAQRSPGLGALEESEPASAGGTCGVPAGLSHLRADYPPFRSPRRPPRWAKFAVALATRRAQNQRPTQTWHRAQPVLFGPFSRRAAVTCAIDSMTMSAPLSE